MRKVTQMGKGKELLPRVYTDPNTGVEKLNFNGLEASLKKDTIKLMAAIKEDMQAFATSALRLGMHLQQAHERLNPLSLFVPFLNHIPGFSTATAYRYMGAYQNAQKLLPEAIVRQALASGMDIISYQKDKPFGRYQEVVKRLPPPKDPTPDQAIKWLEEVDYEYKAAKQKTRKEAKLPSAENAQREAFRAVVQRYGRIPKENQNVKWLVETFGYILSALGFDAPVNAKPLKPPKSWVPEKKEKKAKAATKKEKEGTEGETPKTE